MIESENSYVKLWELFRGYLAHRYEGAKLTATEKATVLLSALVLIMAGVLLGVTVLFFISLGLVQFMVPYVGAGWAYIIMGSAVLVLAVLVLLLRNPLIVNPVARFISRVLLK